MRTTASKRRSVNAPSCAPPELARSIEHARIPADPKLERARADRLDQHESPGGRSGCLGVASSREARGCSRAGARTVDRVTAVPLAKWTVHGSRSPGRWSEVRAPPVRLGRPRSAQPYHPTTFCSKANFSPVLACCLRASTSSIFPKFTIDLFFWSAWAARTGRYAAFESQLHMARSVER